jgi:hypothetical protein
VTVKYPTHVVVDTIDGFTFTHDASGVLFTKGTATAFAREANAAGERIGAGPVLRKPGSQAYALFSLKPSAVEGPYTLSEDGNVVYPL